MKNIELIKAGAGSGKTYTLTERISGMIREGLSPESLVATTFTVKAANELKQRIRSTLFKENNPDAAIRILESLIGTVNGVCGRLLSEYAIEAGLPPSLNVIAEEISEEIFDAAFREVIEDCSENLRDCVKRLKMDPLVKDKNKNRQQPDWKDDVRSILDFTRSNCFSVEQLKVFAGESCKFAGKIFKGTRSLPLSKIIEDLRPVLRVETKTGTAAKILKEIQKFEKNPTWYHAIKIAKSTLTKELSSYKEIFEDLSTNIPDSKELLDDVCEAIRLVFDCAGKCIERYQACKESLGVIDFVDQEALLLDNLRGNEALRSLLGKRMKKIIVDEFQDTSPIQLALFLELNKLAEFGSVWVGDPKQAIYGFRGSDPKLLISIADSLENTEKLGHSWRSRKELVRLANAVFVPAFSSEDVSLSVPPERENSAAGGTIEAWHLLGSKSSEYSEALADGIDRLIREENIAPKDIAVLCETNENCRELTKSLNARNIQASSPAGELSECRECRLAMAGFRYCADPKDSVALVSVAALSGAFPDWLKQISTGETPEKALEKLREHELFKALKSYHKGSPLEILQHVIATLDLDARAETSSNASRKRSNLAELRRICSDYCSRMRTTHGVATASGFIRYWETSKHSEPPSIGKNTVNVLTYHKSKGLEWPVVILSSLNKKIRKEVFGVHIRSAKSFNPKKPLDGRSIHYLPKLFGKQKVVDLIEQRLERNDFQKEIVLRQSEELKRLMYVGLTRARDRIIFALTKNEHGWLDNLCPNLTWRFPEAAGMKEWEIGNEKFSLTTRVFPKAEPPSNTSPDSEQAIPVFENNSPLPDPEKIVPALPARLAPSCLAPVAGTASLLKNWGKLCELPQCPKNKWNLLGDAFHNFLALSRERQTPERAVCILKSLQMFEYLTPGMLIISAQNLRSFLTEFYPDGKVLTEVPITLRNPQGQCFQGFVDMLVETPAGWIIIDHKTGTPATGQKTEEFVCNYAAQLDVYRQAVGAATGKPVLDCVVHMPLFGECYSVKTES